ncbi:FtsW/RodA/SpoVE family cell cycle protein [Actinomadura sp. WMMB 499]|uniref:FtsW/RodA/SpoVE family cell cycle protein n=1 Tax=Actinomadura sp. WMMB 499 TaxID=1219491 RepID=UPI00124583EE|nr:FtsW/RodA/SpoVE family cell cycle protein [Actinomadura sp. WMMB 499]QFG23099.1 FtsW/RodA/SpoVE family cell cycle protein [Actinomadura sp. WMMB 499]
MSSLGEQIRARLPYQRRNAASLVLLVFAMVLTLSAFAEVGLARDGSIPAGMFGYGGGLVVLAVSAYFVQMKFAPYADPVLLPLAVALNGIGFATIYRLDLDTSADWKQAALNGRTLEDAANAADQLMWTFVGIGMFVAALLIMRDTDKSDAPLSFTPKTAQRYTYLIGLGAIIMLLLPVVPGLGNTVNGARVWIQIPGVGGLQPAEFAKLMMVAFFAGYLVNKRQAMSLIGKKFGPLSLPRLRDLGPVLVIWFFCLGVLFIQKDLGTALLFFGLFVSMLYIATQRLSWIMIGLGLLAVGVFVAMQLPFMGHVDQRISIWQNPTAYFDGGCLLDSGEVVPVNPNTEIYEKFAAQGSQFPGTAACAELGGAFSDSRQLMMGLFSLGEGGVLGTGLGQGEPWRTPLAFSDFIFTSIGEELGLTGLMALLLMYGLIVQRGMKTALAARDSYLKLFAGGVSFVLALQVFVIVGGVTKLIPLTGLTTPFLSQGGSSMMANWILIAILVRMSHDARKPAPQAIQDEGMTQIVSTR